MKSLRKIPIYKNTPTNGIVFSNLLHSIDYPCLLEPLVDDKKDDFEPYLRDIDKKIILDLGCGIGSKFILFLKRNGYIPKSMIHLDADPEVFKRIVEGATPWQEENLFYDWNSDLKIIGDALQIPLPNNSVDIVNQAYVFADNYKLDRERALEEICRILKPRGIYITGDLPDYVNVEQFGLKKEKECCAESVYRKIKH